MVSSPVKSSTTAYGNNINDNGNNISPTKQQRRNKKKPNVTTTRKLVVFVLPLLFLIFVSVPWILSWHLDDKHFNHNNAISSSLQDHIVGSSETTNDRDKRIQLQKLLKQKVGRQHSSPHHNLVTTSQQQQQQQQQHQHQQQQHLRSQQQQVPPFHQETGKASGMIGNNLQFLLSQKRKQQQDEDNLKNDFNIPLDTNTIKNKIPIINNVHNNATTTIFDTITDTNQHINKLPKWMKDYFKWHNEMTQSINKENWNSRDSKTHSRNYQFIVLRCFLQDERCGGLSDRLKPLPLMVLAAYQSNRILYLSWTRPCPLEEFIVPNVVGGGGGINGGINWTVPYWLLDEFQKPGGDGGSDGSTGGESDIIENGNSNEQRLVTRAQTLLATAKQKNYHTIYVHLHDGFGGSTHYNDEILKLYNITNGFERVYHDLWRSMMKPSYEVEKRINTKLKLSQASSSSNPMNHERPQNLLVPGKYAVAHFRAEYGKEVVRHPVLSTKRFLTNVALNALYCASELYPNGGPIYFASDSMTALEAVRNYSIVNSTRPIITFDRDEDEPLHLDKIEIEIDSYGKSSSGLRSQLEFAEQRRINDKQLLNFATNISSTLVNTSSSTTVVAAVASAAANVNNANTTTRRTVPSDYYSTFVDFYIAGNGVCVAYGRGGFGRYANILSYNWSCAKRHVKNFFPETCTWHD